MINHFYVKNNTFFCITKHFKFVYPTEDWERILRESKKNSKEQKMTVEYNENITTVALIYVISEEYSLLEIWPF